MVLFTDARYTLRNGGVVLKPPVPYIRPQNLQFNAQSTAVEPTVPIFTSGSVIQVIKIANMYALKTTGKHSRFWWPSCRALVFFFFSSMR